MKKYVLSLFALLTLCVAFCLTAPDAEAATSGTCGKNLTWTLDDAGTLTISGTGAMKDWISYSSVPWYSNRSSIKTVVIADGVTIIGDYAFSLCDSLTSVTIPDSVTTIGDYAFSHCDSWISVTIPDSVTTIGDCAFSHCKSLTSVTIPDNVTTIGHWAFSSCDSLTSVTIPDSVTTIGGWPFFNCDSLTGIWVNPNNPYYSSDTKGVLFNKDKTTLVQAPGKLSGAYGIPDSVTTINRDAFYSCDSLTSVTIPDNVTTIGRSAFSSCTSLTSVTIPDSVTTIGEEAFFSCTSLTSVTIPDSVTTIGEGAFYYCDNLTSVTIPDSVTTIGGSAFSSCISLTHVAYTGTRSQWGKISIGDYNEELTGATLHYEISFQNKENCVVSGVYCPVCEKFIVSTVKEGGAHSYTDGVCTICGAADPDYVPPKYDIDAARMILGNSLDFQFGVAMSKFEDVTGVYAVVEKGTVTKTIPATQWGTVGQYYAIVYDGLAAKEMADEISVTIYNADGEAISNAKTDSVRQYVARAFDGQTAEGKTMMVDMLNYGAAAQVKFNYNTGDLANNQLTAAQKACGTATLTATVNNQAKGPNFVGTRLVLESRIQMQVAFSGMDRTMYAIYSYTDHNGTEQNLTVNGTDFISVNGMYGIELNELVYADARTLVTVRVYKADGTLYSGAKDSIQSYVNRSGETDALFEALMKFTDSAKAYLH